jgi:hypothetical protein
MFLSKDKNFAWISDIQISKSLYGCCRQSYTTDVNPVAPRCGMIGEI